MAIPGRYRARCAYHFTALDNLDSIIDFGLLATNEKVKSNIHHRDVANPDIQHRRNTMVVPASNGLCVHDFVPFYFAMRTSMLLAVLNQKNVDQRNLLYFEVSLLSLESRQDVFFTDASANTEDPPGFYNLKDAEFLKEIDWELVDSNKWKFEGQQKQRRMAELLIPTSVDISSLVKIIAYDAKTASDVRAVLKRKGLSGPAVVANSFGYFFEPASNWTDSLIAGPIELRALFLKTVQSVQNSPRDNTKYDSLESAVLAIRENFCAIAELEGIDELRADYGPHKDTVGVHSRRVASLVKASANFNCLDPQNKLLLELAAYLHDIGKGPKSRWPDDFMDSADNNHARKSLPMLERILTQDIGGISDEMIRRLVMLVTYDDLLGDIAARGRDKDQLNGVVESQLDLDMLVELSKADIGSISLNWLHDVEAKIDAIRNEFVANFRPVRSL